jgi:hypothetical protein
MENTTLYLYPSYQVASDALSKVYTKISDYKNRDLLPTLQFKNNFVFSYISNLSLEYVYVDFTTSDSIFYRFKLTNSAYEIKWEVFLDSDDEADVESTLHVYKYSTKEKSTYGPLYYIYEVITEVLFKEKNINVEYSSQFIGEGNTDFYAHEYAGDLPFISIAC